MALRNVQAITTLAVVMGSPLPRARLDVANDRGWGRVSYVCFLISLILLHYTQPVTMINTAMEMLKKYYTCFPKNTFLNKLMHKTDGKKQNKKPRTKKEKKHNTTDLFKAVLYADRNRSTTVCYMF